MRTIKNQFMKQTEKQSGFILHSLLVSITVCSVIVTVIVNICMYAVVWDSKLHDSAAMLGDGRYTRRMVTAHIMWNRAPVSVADDGRTVIVHNGKQIAFTVYRRALFRRLSDGSLQPASGSRIIGTNDKRRLDALSVHAFTQDMYKAVHMHWYVNNKLTDNTRFGSGYGGISGYEVASTVSTDYDWFKTDEKNDG